MRVILDSMSTLDAQNSPSLRQIINARRKRHGIIHAILLITAWIGVWIAVAGDAGWLVFFIVMSFLILSVVHIRTDVCPSCGQDISMLPSEGHLRIPELAHSIRYCPYCAGDFSLPESEDAQQAASPAVLAQASQSNETDH